MQDSVKPNGITPSQTVGPFFKYGLTPNGEYAWNDAFTNSTLTPDVSGDRIRIEGRVFDGDGVVVPDVMLEIWQADAQGRFADPQDKRALPNASFRGFARCGTDKDGNYSFDTIKPGVVPDPDGKPQAPHIVLAVFGRGMLRHLYTRIYFSDEAGNAADPVLALVPADRRATLTAVREAGKPLYRLDLHLQGDNETVFFADIALKHDIVLLGHLSNGLGYYRFSYIGSDKAYVGVMAQEVEQVMPDAVTRGSDGYLRVHYEKLGLTFRTYRDWLAGGAKIPAEVTP